MKRIFLYFTYWLLICGSFLINVPAYAAQYKIDVPDNWVNLHDVNNPK